MRAILDVILIIINIYQYVVIAAVVFSWLVAFNVVNMRNQVVSTVGEAIYRLTEPILAPIRRAMPSFGALDLSPIVLLLLLFLLERVIIYYIYPNVF
jgi:YggT family protein